MDYCHSLIIGPTLSGKTHLTDYFIKKHYLNMYDKIILISGSLNSNQEYYKDIPLKNRCNTLNNKVLKYVLNFNFSKSDNFKLLIILDDLNTLLKDKNCVANIEYLYTEGRHKGIYITALVQYYKMLSPCIRINSRYQIITFANNSTLEMMYDYVSNSFENLKELKKFVKEKNINNTCICFDTHSKSRELEDNVFLIF
jgi:hypothetical protein